jgi:acetyl esterase/lipase
MFHRIYHPLTALQPSPVLIYLPSGPFFPDHPVYNEDHFISALSGFSHSTVVRINYRLSQKHPFPTPVYDVLTGYDWILENLVSKSASTPYHGRTSHKIARLGVCGELVGGGLATMLALTECRAGSKRLAAAAVNNPILDWAFPFGLPATEEEAALKDEDIFQTGNDLLNWWNQLEAKEANSTLKKTTPVPASSWEAYADSPILPTTTLLRAREAFFRKPEDYFDRFASPICFFRSPSAEIVYPTDEDKIASLSPSSDPDPVVPPDLYSDADSIFTHNPPHHQQSPQKPADLPTLIKRRTYHRVHPPSNSGLLLPHMYITSGSESPLLDQSSELTRLMKRCVMRQTRTTCRTEDDEIVQQLEEQDKERKRQDADRKVRMSVDDSVGLWSRAAEEEWRPRVEDVGMWLRGVMR